MELTVPTFPWSGAAAQGKVSTFTRWQGCAFIGYVEDALFQQAF